VRIDLQDLHVNGTAILEIQLFTNQSVLNIFWRNSFQCKQMNIKELFEWATGHLLSPN